MKNKRYLVCVDFDGSVMDTMDVKHIHCLGPAFMEVWGMEDRQEEVLSYWNRINLYSDTRGMNRFRAFVMALREKGYAWDMDGFAELEQWTKKTDLWTAASLKAFMDPLDSECCRKAYQWSELADQRFATLLETQGRVFYGVAGVLKSLHQVADVAVISSEKREVADSLWTGRKLMEHVDMRLSAEDGTREHCLKMLLERGYETEDVLVVGSTQEDCLISGEMKTAFYPILAGQEVSSWRELKQTVMEKWVGGRYKADRQEEYRNRFFANLCRISSSRNG